MNHGENTTESNGAPARCTTASRSPSSKGTRSREGELDRLEYRIARLELAWARTRGGAPDEAIRELVYVGRLLEGARGRPTLGEPRSALEDPLIRGLRVYGWQGPSQVGLPMSQCDLKFLALYLKTFEALAARTEDEGRLREAKRDRFTAGRAHHWLTRRGQP